MDDKWVKGHLIIPRIREIINVFLPGVAYLVCNRGRIVSLSLLRNLHPEVLFKFDHANFNNLNEKSHHDRPGNDSNGPEHSQAADGGEKDKQVMHSGVLANEPGAQNIVDGGNNAEA
jgi:hypothetical protein